jgi:hypothetical protein
MTYRQLQANLKAAREQGLLPKTFKLNQTKKSLELVYNSFQAAETSKVAEESFNADVRTSTQSVESLTKVATLTIANEHDDFEAGFASVMRHAKELSDTYYGGKEITIVPVTHLKGVETQWMNTNHVSEALLYVAA